MRGDCWVDTGNLATLAQNLPVLMVGQGLFRNVSTPTQSGKEWSRDVAPAKKPLLEVLFRSGVHRGISPTASFHLEFHESIDEVKIRERHTDEFAPSPSRARSERDQSQITTPFDWAGVFQTLTQERPDFGSRERERSCLGWVLSDFHISQYPLDCCIVDQRRTRKIPEQ